MEQRHTLFLTKERETLLIPLYGRAKADRFGLPADTSAQRILERVDYDFARLRIPAKIQIFMTLRSLLMDGCVTEFLAEHPGGLVLNLGCGLDTRCLRTSGYGQWFDLDFPDVISLRRALLEDVLPDHVKMIGSSVTEQDWIETLPPDSGPVLVVMEGLLMYLRPEEISLLFQSLSGKYSDCTFLFDAYSHLTVKGSRFQPSLSKTKAEIHWGMDRAEELSALCPNLKLQRKLYLTDAPEIKALPGYFRWMFHTAGRFSAAREAHRIFVFRTVERT